LRPQTATYSEIAANGKGGVTMKARVYAKLPKSYQQAINHEAYKQCVEVHQAYEHALDVLIAYTLREHFGFGCERIRKFFLATAENQILIKKAYSGGHTNDKTMPEFVMEYKLEQDGIDFKGIIEETNRYADELSLKG
jgi:hypothetical protein